MSIYIRKARRRPKYLPLADWEIEKICIEKNVIRRLGGVYEAAVMAYLLEVDRLRFEDKLEYPLECGHVPKIRLDGWFIALKRDILKSTLVTIKRQIKIVKNLESLGVIETKMMGMPARRMFRINYKRYSDLFGLDQSEYLKAV